LFELFNISPEWAAYPSVATPYDLNADEPRPERAKLRKTIDFALSGRGFIIIKYTGRCPVLGYTRLSALRNNSNRF